MNLALFDFDGTLTTREMLPDFFRRAIPRRRLLIGQVLLAPLIVGYKLGLVSGTVVRSAIVRFGFTGLAFADYDAAGAAFAADVQARLCLQGAGVCVLPRPLGDRLPGLERLDLGEDPPGRDTWLGYHRDLRRLARLRALIDFVVARLAS